MGLNKIDTMCLLSRGGWGGVGGSGGDTQTLREKERERKGDG